MKKMLLATALFSYYRMCSTIYCSKQTDSSSTKTITHHFFVSGIGQKKTVDAAKIFVAAQKMLLKQKLANIRKMDCSVFIVTLGIYTPLEACVCSQ